MNLALTYLWKEWRAQRGLLFAYSAMVFTCLCIGLSLAPRHYWFEEGFGVHALTWFVVAGVMGVIAFVVPGLVRSEFVADKGDQFIRRLPGALVPSFVGKSIFLLLTMLLLPLLGLLIGEMFVEAWGYDWNGLYGWVWVERLPKIVMQVPSEIFWCGGALLLVPWVWATGTWTPGGRLSLLATVLLGLLVGVCVFAVLRQCPRIVDKIDWTPWLWTVPVSGVVAAAVSWARGRRGGGAMRSARIGLLATAVMLLPGGAWLGQRAYFYWHPRTDRLGQMQVMGLDASGRYALVGVSERQGWPAVNRRVDLQTGRTIDLPGLFGQFGSRVVGPSTPAFMAQHDLWEFYDGEGGRDLFDLQRLEWFDLGEPDASGRFALPSELQRRAFAQTRTASGLRAPGGVRVWVEHDEICFENPDGCVDREPWPIDGRGWMWPMGHAIRVPTGSGYYDLMSRQFVPWQLSEKVRWQVGRVRMLEGREAQGHGHRKLAVWQLQIDGGSPHPCEELRGASVLGLLDDEHVLARSGQRLFRFEPATGDVVDIALPAGLPEIMKPTSPLEWPGSLLERDPWNCVWLKCSRHNMRVFLRIDAETLHASAVLNHSLDDRLELIAWDQNGVVTYGEHSARIVRHDLETGEQQVLFPRER